MVAPEILELYQKFVPRWFKVIRWRAMAERHVDKWKFIAAGAIVPYWFCFFVWQNPYPMYLCLKQPQTDEERLALKRDCYYMPFQRDWELGQYQHGRPPYMDVWKRRRQYPEYYEGKYDGFRQDAVYNQAPTPIGSGIVVNLKKSGSA